MKKLSIKEIKGMERKGLISKDREGIKSEDIFNKLYNLKNKERINFIKEMEEEIPFWFDEISDFFFYEDKNFKCILVLCKDEDLSSFDIFTEREY